MPTFQFKIELKHLKEPPVWRRLLVPDNIAFGDLHLVIQIAFGWQNYHLWQFSPKGFGSEPLIKPYFEDGFDDFQGAEDADEITLTEIFTQPKQTFVYIYDFGDSWEHLMKLEKILDEESVLPVCTGGEGACPPEDCGGVWGYMSLLETLANPKSPEYKEMRQWLGLKKGEQWDANAFHLEAINAELRTLAGG